MELKIPKFLIRKETKKQKSRDLGEIAFGREKEGRKWAHLTSQPGDPKTSDKVKTKLRMQTWKKILDRSRKRELTDV
jgi:hypothetical protein